jgi:hypothetical protein
MQIIEEEDTEPQVMNVRVVNLNDFDIPDMFNSVPFTFKAHGKSPAVIPVDAAHHIFGWFPPYRDQKGDWVEPDPVEMKRHIMRRWGWNTPAMIEGDRGQIFYDNIKIAPIVYRMVPIDLDNDGQPIKNGRAPKTNKLMDAVDRAMS